ncbi:MAG: DNA polymerase-3 subunit delta' [Candidatus Azotimanducaceae bacterium]|jgi:DNA polymerase-3 subunit delta'
MELMKFTPWQESARVRISHQFNTQKLPHAFLIEGPEGIGKLSFAVSLAQKFLCASDEGIEACGHCTPCNLVKAGTLSDLQLIQPIDSKQIKIDQIRDIISWVNRTSQQGGLKIAIVNPAHQMNHRSMNALLKCLEEPTPNTLIMLLSSQAGKLLPTIRSRCQAEKFVIPERSQALAWLNGVSPDLENASLKLDIAGGIPLIAQTIDSDFLKNRLTLVKALKSVITEKGSALAAVRLFKKPNLESILISCAQIFADCAKLKLASSDIPIQNNDLSDDMGMISQHCSSVFLISAYERVCKDLAKVRSTSNPNEALLFEGLMMELGRQQSVAISQ